LPKPNSNLSAQLGDEKDNDEGQGHVTDRVDVTA
jgi:hypothetical protein